MTNLAIRGVTKVVIGTVIIETTATIGITVTVTAIAIGASILANRAS